MLRFGSGRFGFRFINDLIWVKDLIVEVITVGKFLKI
jgi:hypothetical protein